MNSGTHNTATRPGVVFLLGLLTMFLAGSSRGMPPHPDIRAKIAASPAARQICAAEIRSQRERGVDQPDDVLRKILDSRSASLSPQAPVNFRALVLLVDFTDNVRVVNASFFDHLVFDSSGVSVRTYYDEISFGQFEIVTVHLPSATGWFRAPQTYPYYVDGQGGMGDYPNNTQKLVEDLVDAADPYVNFASYDNDGNGYVDALIVVHSGPGREYTGSDDDIHSHKWGINARRKDNVYISSYTIQPEYLSNPNDMTIGVFCHELGHIFGLPDLYDTDMSSFGVGAWCLMAYGSWNGINGNSPAHPSAWCLDQLGFAEKTNVTANVTAQPVAAVEDGGSIYRLWTGGDALSQEYFLVENRQKLGFDAGLPSSGLLIWHIDESKWNVTDNDGEWFPGLSPTSHYLVALEQADSLYQLEKNLNQGNGGDPYPGSTANFSFSVSTDPSSDSYLGGSTMVAIQNISTSAPVITADLVVGMASGIDDPSDLLPATVELAQNYPNPFNPTTTIQFWVDQAAIARLDIYNVMGQHVATLLERSVPAGTTEVTWDGTSDIGDQVASGLYLYRLAIDSQEQVKKMVLVR